MSTVAEIEAAIDHLPTNEMLCLRQWLFAKTIEFPVGKPKTGAELAAISATRFHLRPEEADALADEI